MPIARAQKEERATKLREELSEMPHAILVDFRGLDVAGATDLRRKLRDGEARFKVVKNSIALRAIEELPLAELKDAFVGQTAIAYTDGDIVGLAKTLREFADEFETPSFKGGIVDGELISAEQFEQLAELPPREQLIAKALYLMNYPITGFVTALSGIMRGFVTVLDQIREQKQEAGEAVEPSADDAGDSAAEEAVAPEAAAEAGSEEATEEAPPEEEAAEAAADDAPAEEADEAAPEDASEEAPPQEAAEETPAEDAPAEEAAEAASEEASEEAPAEEAAEETPADEEAAVEDAGEDEDDK